jgi:Icc-related predicted phosphoesterase
MTAPTSGSVASWCNCRSASVPTAPPPALQSPHLPAVPDAGNKQMKIQLLSDLHLETHPHFVPTPAPDADVLVLAGDIGSYQRGSMLGRDDFGLSRFSPLKGWPVPVLFVPGNHEYDALEFDQAHSRLRETCDRLGITFLERSAVLSEALVGSAGPRVRFLGTTLWSDFDALADPSESITERVQSREKAFRAANHYLRKAGTYRNRQPMLAEQVREQALLCQSWLRETLAAPFEGHTVVLTHFAPSLLSADPRYGLTPGTAGFCNALDALLAQAQLWLHGHLHCPSDYVTHGCRVVANPLGYARKGEQTAFKPDLCLRLPDDACVSPGP